MPVSIPLDPIPNQDLTFNIDDTFYQLTLRALDEEAGVMTIVRDNVTIVRNSRIVNGRFIIPFDYLEDGNFIFVSEDDQIPSYQGFGDTQLLTFFNQQEVEDLRRDA